jgi:hypothetical protein
MSDPHSTVTRELLVRYLDAWTPSVLRSHRRATYIDTGRDVRSALRVFGEFSDRLAGHELAVVLIGAEVPPDAGEGLSVRAVADPAELTVTGPALAHLEVGGVLDEQAVWRLVGSLTPGKGREVLLTVPSTTADEVHAHRTRLREAGLAHAVAVELADDAGHAQLLLFATGDPKHLATFKEELWAADEFAGIRYRDPLDAEHTPIDISLNPPLRPLRQALLDELARRGSCTVADLQRHTLEETIYRTADTVKVLTSAATAGAITREPPKGRLSPRTVVSHG